MENSLWLTIPSGTRREYLADIIRDSGIPKSQIVLVNTIDCEPTSGIHNLYSYILEPNIQRWWNKGIRYAMDYGATHVAVLNDDVELTDNPLQKIFDLMVLEDATIGYPLPASSDPCGYCFILNTKHGIFPDESYKWWYGDNDLYRRAKKTIGVLAKVRHIHPNELTSSSPKLMELAAQDQLTWQSS